MKRYLVISFLVVGLALGGVSSACAEGKISVGVRAGLGNFDMADINETLTAWNTIIGFLAYMNMNFGRDTTAEYLQEIKSGMDIEGYVGYNITDKLAVRLIAGYLASKSSGSLLAEDPGYKLTLDLKWRPSSYFGGVEPVIRFDLERATVWLGAGVAYYWATLSAEYNYEETGQTPEHETLKLTGSKVGYHGFLEGELPLTERVKVGAWVGFRSTGVIDVEEDGATDKLDFSGMFYGGCISFAV